MSGRFTTTTSRTAQKKSAQVRRAKALEKHIRTVLSTAPPLTDAQRANLAAILRPSGGGDAA